MDMSTTITPKSDQLNADDLIGGPLVIKVTRVSANPGGNGADQPVNVYFEGDGNKPFRLCKSMRRVMVAIWGKDASQNSGRSMKIYRDPEVTWGGMKVGGIRISHMSHMDKPEVMALTATQKQRKPYRVDPLMVDESGTAPAAPAAPSAIVAAAHAEARRGTEAFRAFWNRPETKEHWAALKPMIAEFQKAAADADAATDSDPFGLPPVDDAPTDYDTLTPEQREELARVESEVRESERVRQSVA